jgi:hypothetical protein
VPEPSADQCPYARPFPADFDTCSAYLPTQFIPLDTHHRPMAAAWTCWNLAVRARPDLRGAYYAACRIGDAEARRRWVEVMDAGQVELMRSLRRRFIGATGAEFAAFWKAKAESVRGGRRAELRNAAQRLHDAFDRFCAGEEADLAEIGMPRPLAMEIVDAWLEILVERPSAEVDWRLPAELTRRLPARARGFYDPESLTGTGSETSP